MRVAPPWWAPAAARRTKPTFVESATVLAWPTSRRMSFPASGLTTIPTVDTGGRRSGPGPGERAPDALGDAGGVGHVVLLERRAERHGRERRTDAADGRVEVVERDLLDLGRDLGPETREAHGLVDDDGAVGAPGRLDDRVDVERLQRARIDHLDADPLAGQPVGGGERLVGHPPVGDVRDVGSGPGDVGLAERD